MEHLFGPLAAAIRSHKTGTAATAAVVFAAWKKVAGDGLEDRAIPVGFEDNKLFVVVENEQWLRQMKGFARQILPSLNRALGGSVVKRIEFEVDPAKVAAERVSKVSVPVYQEADISVLSPSLVEAASTISDVELRRKFLQAAARSLGKRD